MRLPQNRQSSSRTIHLKPSLNSIGSHSPCFQSRSPWVQTMSNRVAFLEGRAFPRLALTGLALLWLSGCSSDIARFDAPNPFSNPFGSQTAEAAPAGPAPSSHVAAAPLAPPQSVASASPPQPHQAVGGSAAGWTAVGGSPVIVAQGENLDTLSRRYGVPSAALLSANGLSSAAEVKGGMHIVVPVYNAGDRAVAAGERRQGRRRRLGEARQKARRRPRRERRSEVQEGQGRGEGLGEKRSGKGRRQGEAAGQGRRRERRADNRRQGGARQAFGERQEACGRRYADRQRRSQGRGLEGAGHRRRGRRFGRDA